MTEQIAKGALYRLQYGQVVDQFTFAFNPTTVTESLSTDWYKSGGPGQFLAGVSFKRFKPIQVNFRLFLYSRGGGANADKQLNQLKLFCMPGTDFSVDTPQFVGPGKTKLVLGPDIWTGVTDSVNIIREQFDRDLNVTVARVDVAFTQASKGLEEDVAYAKQIRSRAQYRGL